MYSNSNNKHELKSKQNESKMPSLLKVSQHPVAQAERFLQLFH